MKNFFQVTLLLLPFPLLNLFSGDNLVIDTSCAISLFFPSQFPSLAPTTFSLQRRRAQFRSFESLSAKTNIPTSGVDVAFSQRSSLSSSSQTGHLFSTPTSQSHSILTSSLISTLLPLHLIALTNLLLSIIFLTLVLVKIPEFYTLPLIN